jgi:hypothetical protein
MPLQAQKCVVAVHSNTVVCDLNYRDASSAGQHFNACCFGVDRVFNQLLDHSGGPLDNLACGNLACDVFWKELNA